MKSDAGCLSHLTGILLRAVIVHNCSKQSKVKKNKSLCFVVYVLTFLKPCHSGMTVEKSFLSIVPCIKVVKDPSHSMNMSQIFAQYFRASKVWNSVQELKSDDIFVIYVKFGVCPKKIGGSLHQGASPSSSELYKNQI